MQKGLVSEEVNGAQAQRLAALDAWIAKAGTGQSSFTDVARDKYKHLADSLREPTRVSPLDLGFCGVERVSKEDESLAIDLVRSHEDKITRATCLNTAFVAAIWAQWLRCTRQKESRSSS